MVTRVCGYSILEIGPTRSTSVNKHHNGSFSTRDQAEVAALEALQAEIDLYGAISELQC
jgi:hypothetical protein